MLVGASSPGKSPKGVEGVGKARRESVSFAKNR